MPHAINPATTLPQLAAPERYVPCRWDLTAEHEKRAYWLTLFREHFPTLLERAIEVETHDGASRADAEARAASASKTFNTYLEIVREVPQAFGHLDILRVCYEREVILRGVGFADPYRLAKARENDLAIRVLPRVLEELDGLDPAERHAQIARGVFAGNIFDLGAVATNAKFSSQSVDFHGTLDDLKPRPWLVDDLDALLAKLDKPSWRTALLFVDNAGPDVVLGMIPLARELVRLGVRVILAANSRPSLNDVTIEELRDLLTRAAEFDATLRDALADGRLRAMGDGNGAPLIDLTVLDPDFVAAIRGEPIDLVVLEGMGRAIESNFDAAFTCDVLKVAMIKDRGVAEAMGGDLYDLVLRFEAAR